MLSFDSRNSRKIPQLKMAGPIERKPEPEYMDDPLEAAAYAEADFSDVNQAFVERLIELEGGAHQLEALDLGTGPADIPVRVLRLRPEWRIIAVDASLPMLKIAARRIRDEKLQRRIRLILADAKATGLASQAFPVLFSNSLLHHVSDTRALWLEIKRLVSPGGLIFLRDLFRPDSEQEALRIVEEYAGGESSLLKQEFLRSLLSAYTPEEIRSQLSEVGLQCLEVVKVTDRHVDIFGRVA